MTLHRDSFLYHLAYFFSFEWDIPRKTTLCALFWRTILSSIGVLLCCSLVGLLLGTLVFVSIANPLTFVLSVGLAAVLGGGTFAIITVAEKYRESQEKPPATIVGYYFRAVKSKICPIIEIKQRDK